MTQTTSPSDLSSLPVAPAVASVQLRAASSLKGFWLLALSYLALIAIAWWPAAIVLFFILPLNCQPSSPRRALWLWTVGLLAGAMAIMKSRQLVASMGGLDGVFSHPDALAIGSLALGVIGAALFLWMLTWIKSPRRV